MIKKFTFLKQYNSFFKYNNAPKILGHSHAAAPRKFFRRNVSC